MFEPSCINDLKRLNGSMLNVINSPQMDKYCIEVADAFRLIMAKVQPLASFNKEIRYCFDISKRSQQNSECFRFAT